MAEIEIAYLVAERRCGRWILGDDWTRECDTLDEARRVADEWRSHGRGVAYDVGVLAVTLVPEVQHPAVCAQCGSAFDPAPERCLDCGFDLAPAARRKEDTDG